MATKNEESTRDVAIQADTKINQHMTDCTSFRIAIQNNLAELRKDIKELNWRMDMIVGGLTALGKLLDFFVPIIHKG